MSLCCCVSQIGMTALHWSVQKGDIDIVHLLLQHGANAALPNKVSLTCLTLNQLCVDIKGIRKSFVPRYIRL